MHSVIVANGELHKNRRLQKFWERADLRIAADGGARNARLFLERAPHVVIGDMDSLDDETREWLSAADVEMIQRPRAKDETDLELALLLAQTRGAIASQVQRSKNRRQARSAISLAFTGSWITWIQALANARPVSARRISFSSIRS